CPSGKKGTAVGGSCTNCPAGKYRNGWTSTARSCSTCPVDKWSAAGASSCTACPSGTSSPAGSDNVKDCIKKIICNGDYIENSGSCYAQCKNLKQNEICFTSKGVSSNKSKHFTLDPKIAFSDYPSVSECFISGAVRYKPSSNVAKDKFNPDIGRRFKLECMPMVPFDDLNEFVDD
ncbi:MAG: hypothetical protein N4A44_04800, partial [Alphaproteobacteria bacterium]|nr:hypothetical protein [Alphaproteobacteria bacterium]